VVGKKVVKEGDGDLNAVVSNSNKYSHLDIVFSTLSHFERRGAEDSRAPQVFVSGIAFSTFSRFGRGGVEDTVRRHKYICI
jgi:hypothetical protein